MSDPTSKPKTTRKKAVKTPAPGVVIPPWPGISDKALKGLAEKLDKVKDSYRASNMIRKVNGDDWGSRQAIAWHLVACRAIHPEANVHLFELVSEAPEEPTPEVALELLIRVSNAFGSWFKQTTCILDRYSLTMDKLLLATYRRAPELVKSREAEMSTGLRLGLSFIRRRLGETIAPAASMTILKQLAEHQATSYGITLNIEVPTVVNGELVEHRLGDLAALRKLALLFGTDQEWDATLLAAALDGDWQDPRNVRDVFRTASTEELAKLLNRSSIDIDDALRLLLEVIPVRGDDPRALLEAAKTLTEEPKCREMLLVGVILRCEKTGVSVPDELDELLTCELLDSTYEGVREGCIEWFSCFPRERALVIARRLLQDEYQYSRAVGILAVYFDEQLLHAALEKDVEKNYIGQETLGGLGAVALPQLEWAYEKAADDKRRARHRSILFAMAKTAKTQTLDERWERFIDFDREGTEALPYYSSSDAKLRESVLAGIPEPRKSSLLSRRALESENPERLLQLAHLAAGVHDIVDVAIRRMVERRNLGSGFREIAERLGEPVVEALCRHIGLSEGDGAFLQSLESALSTPEYERIETALQRAGVKKETLRDALMRICAQGPEPKTRVYSLQVGKDGYEPKPGTLSRSGGTPPGIAEADYPKGDDGEAFTHLFTLDLEEIPELMIRYGGARAIAAFCPDPNSGDRTDEFTFVPISQQAVDALPNTVSGDDEDEDDVAGSPIAVLPLDVPMEVFEKSDDAPFKEIHKMLFNAAGHVLGEPFWIQGDEGGDDFVMQINEGLAELNLGDCGSLYVFDSGTVFQCY